jgi:hypothetical protein
MRTPTAVGAILATSILVLTPSSVAVADAAEHVRNTVTDVSCAFQTAEGDSVFLYASASSQDGTTDSAMFVETPDEQPILMGDGGSVVFGPSFAANVFLYDFATGEPVGEASVTATMAPDGEPVVSEVRDRGGNTWAKGTMTSTEFTVTVTSVNVPGYTVLPDAADCSGSELTFDLLTTDPAARIYKTPDFRSAICALEGLPYGEVRLRRDVRTPVFEVVVDDGIDPLKASGVVPLNAWSGSATAPLTSLATGEPVTDLTIEVTLERAGRRGQDSATFDGVTLRVSWVPYVANIRVTTTDGRTGTAACYAEDVLELAIIRPGSA